MAAEEEAASPRLCLDQCEQDKLGGNGAFCGMTDMSVSPTFFFPYKAVGGPPAAAELPGAPEGQGHGMPLGVIQGSLS